MLPIPHSSEKVIQVGDNLTDDQLEDLRIILDTHAEASSLHGELGKTTLGDHKIEFVGPVSPIAVPLRRRPITHVEETRRQVKAMLADGIIEESSSPWAAAYVLVRKKTGEFRLYIDFRQLNQVTKKNAFPLPRIEACLEALTGKKFYSQFDFAAGYWQLPVAPDSREYTAFRTEDGHYQFRVMPFGLINAPASFQKLMNTLLAGVTGLEVQVYLDDVCLASDSWPEHLALLNKFFDLVRKANLKLKSEECLLGASSCLFLGHLLSATGIKQDPRKMAAIKNLASPKDAQESRRALGFLSYYRKFLPQFAVLSSPLFDLNRKMTKFEWGIPQETAFRKLIDELLHHATLAHLDPDSPITVKTDASRLGLAGMLLQEKDGENRLVACCSRRLRGVETNYGVTDLEGLAVRLSAQL